MSSDREEPNAADLAAIEAEMPLIVAGVAVVDALSAVLRDPGDQMAQRRFADAKRHEQHIEDVEARRSLLVLVTSHALIAAMPGNGKAVGRVA